MTMMTATMMAGERVDSDKDDDKTKTQMARTRLTSLFDTTTNLWSISGREGGDFDDDEDCNNDHDDNEEGQQRGLKLRGQ